MHPLLDVRRLAGVFIALLLAACSSGGGGNADEDQRIGLSAESLSFAAAAPDSSTPATQVVTATFGSDIANVSVVHTGAAVARVTSTGSGRTATISVEPVEPSALGPGIFSSTLAVTGYFCADAGCTSLRPGNTETVRVSYQISPLVRLVSPYVSAADTPGLVILRGYGFSRFAVTGVRFGTANGTELRLFSDSEARVTHPALTAGSYPVELIIPTHTGAVPTQATLVVVEAPDYAAQTLDYPQAVTTLRSLIYDAQRQALIVAADDRIIRYAFANGAWGAPTQVTLANLRDVALSSNGTQLFALSTTDLHPYDAADLAPQPMIDGPTLATNVTFKNLVVTNENRALITTGTNQSSATTLYEWLAGTTQITPMVTSGINAAGNNATPAIAANRLAAVFVQGHSSTTAAQVVFVYSASTRTFAPTEIEVLPNGVLTAIDRDSTRFAINGRNVYDANFETFGTLPASTAAVAFSPDGKRLYTYDTTEQAILTFDSATDRNTNALPRIGDAAPVVAAPGNAPRMIISPDGGTLFLAGTNRLVIQPAP